MQTNEKKQNVFICGPNNKDITDVLLHLSSRVFLFPSEQSFRCSRSAELSHQRVYIFYGQTFPQLKRWSFLGKWNPFCFSLHYTVNRWRTSFSKCPSGPFSCLLPGQYVHSIYSTRSFRRRLVPVSSLFHRSLIFIEPPSPPRRSGYVLRC